MHACYVRLYFIQSCITYLIMAKLLLKIVNAKYWSFNFNGFTATRVTLCAKNIIFVAFCPVTRFLVYF